MNPNKYLANLCKRKTIVCPFCNVTFYNNDLTVRYYEAEFTEGIKASQENTKFGEIYYNLCQKLQNIVIPFNEESMLIIEYVKCPDCKEMSIVLHRPYTEEIFHIYPKFMLKNYPDYIPEAIRRDYQEACMIADLSPKASATLSRRCLQGIIRDFFNINEDTLYKEIEKAAQQPTITKQQHDALHALRKLGNIGAHPEKDVNVIVDVEPHEAAAMIKLVEFFLTEWYIHRHEADELLSDIVSISDQKQAIKQNPPPNLT